MLATNEQERPRRRSRMHRASVGKRIELTARDIEIFKLLARYRYLRSTYLHAFVGGASATRFKERLGHLFHEGRYINRPAEQWQAINARYSPAIYELDDRGEEVLEELGIVVAPATPLVRRGRMGANRQFAHALMICDTLASIELGTRSDQSIRFISWQEILGKAPEKTRAAENPFKIETCISYRFAKGDTVQSTSFGLVPDALFGLEYQKHDGSRSFRFFALEAEHRNRVWCGNLEQTSWLKKVLAYREIVASGTQRSHLGIPNLLVLAVVPHRARIEAMNQLVLEVTGGKGSVLFLFRDIPVFGHGFKAPAPMPELLTVPWERAGHPDLPIAAM